MDNKQFILEKAVQLFSQKGYEGVGVQEICQASGVTKPTLYYYFKSKQGLLEYIASSKGNELLSKIQTALIYNHDFIKSLTLVLKAEIQFALENRQFFELHSTLLNSPEGSEQRTIYSNLIIKIEKLFEDFFISSCNEFGNMKGKEKLYSILFHSNVVSVARLVSVGILEYSEALVYQIVHSTVYGIAN